MGTVVKLERAEQPGPCDAIEAEFVYWPQRCGVWTDLTTEDGGETFYVCEQHVIAASRPVQP